VHLLIGASLALTSAWAVAQDAPESLLPPGFDRPAPKAAPQPAPPSAGTGGATRSDSQPVVQAIPGDGAAPPPPVALPADVKLPTLQELEALSPDELAERMGLKPKFDMPAAARRAMQRVGVIDENEGGLSATSLAGQNASLVRAALAGNKGLMMSRWGHILLRRALVSRLDAPAGMDPADFAALRAALLVRMGEGEAARAVVQDIDTGNFTPQLTQAAMDAYVATADFTGICPAVALQGGARTDPQWQVSRGICAAFQGDANAMQLLDRAQYQGVMPKIDMLLAQKYAGAAAKARRAVKIEWDDVKEMTPWRYGLTIAVGLEPPQSLMKDAGARYAYTAATAPMLGLSSRAAAADQAAAAGVLSAAAMVDLYGQLYAEDDINDEWSGRADQLRNAYVANTPADRLSAIKQLWEGADDTRRYSRQVLTAYAAARLPASDDLVGDAPGLIASMLSAGLDGNAVRWAGIVPEGSLGWGQLMAAAPGLTNQVGASAIASFKDDDSSQGSRKTAFLIAGLAGLDRVSAGTAKDVTGDLGIDLNKPSRWSKLIQQAADVDNQTLVVLLAGVAMQGDGWDKMTPRYLYNIVSALRKVGLEPEARMIAAEAVARG
jgi:hypothetical protein